MLRSLLIVVLALLPLHSLSAADGIASQPSDYSFTETVDRLEAALRSRNITVFARIDHAAEAAKAGLAMPPTQVLIFGNPRAGTPLMLAAPLIAIDLPLKVLVQQDSAGKVSISYNTARFLQQRYGLNDEQAKVLNAVEGLVAAALK
ncbi:MAG: DUF302 domain-containing protein [Reyranella sp.]|nr:DUF302 domain-containing protein [Reyranella sp.]